MQRPLFLVGAARSGTTIVAEVLAAHPDIAFWNEPKYVWRHGAHGSQHDLRKPDEATPPIAGAIRQRFERFLAASGRGRFMEKTPTNCFRVGFMHRVFPDGLFLHLQRDGRDVAASALQRWRSPPDDGAILRRLRHFEMPLRGLHHYLPDMAYELILRRLRPRRGYLWGPRYPGIHTDLLAGRPVEEICALQWAHSARAAASELSTVPAAQRFTFRYERFVKSPDLVLEEIQGFAGLRPAAHVRQAAHQMLASDRGGGFSRLLPAQRRVIEAICLPVMRELGIAPAEVAANT